MAALTDLSALLNRATGGNSGTPLYIPVDIQPRVGAAAAAAPVAGRVTSLWQYGRSYNSGSSTAIPTSATAPTEATAGALPHTDPGGGRQRWLTGVFASGTQACTLILYDRLLHISGLSGTSTSAQTVGGSLTRNTGGVGNEIWVEIYTQIGASSTTITASYTDNAGNSGQTSQATAIGNTGLREAQRIIPIPLADGDTGVQAVASVTLAATTGTAGDFGVTIARPILRIPIDGPGCGKMFDMLSDVGALPELVANGCYALAMLASTTTGFAGSIAMASVEA